MEIREILEVVIYGIAMFAGFTLLAFYLHRILGHVPDLLKYFFPDDEN